MRSTEAKVQRIISKDYSKAKIGDGAEWYIGDGDFLDKAETKAHLIELMDHCQESVNSALFLNKTIEDELERYKITGNLFNDVLELSECLSIIEIYAVEYIRTFRNQESEECNPDDNLSFHDDDELPF